MRGKLKRAVKNSTVYRILTSGTTKMVGVLGLVGLAMTISFAGILSGIGLLLISLIAMKAAAIVGSSLLLSFSIAVFIACYIWLTQ